MSNGAYIKTLEKTIKWTQKESIIQVETNKDIYHCKKLILSAGAWAGKLHSKLNQKLKVTRQMLAWVNPKNPGIFELGKLPCWTVTDPKYGGFFYGFPIIDPKIFGEPVGFKLGLHYPAKKTDPDTIDRNKSQDEELKIVNFLKEFLPNEFSINQVQDYRYCMYTYSPDEDFIIDFDPENENVLLAAGFSGHGFKFASVIGEILADMAIKGKTDQPIQFLNANRF